MAAQYFLGTMTISLAWHAKESCRLIDCNKPRVFIEHCQMCHRRGRRAAAYYLLKTTTQKERQNRLTLCLTGFVGHTMMAYLTLWGFAVPKFGKGKGDHIMAVSIVQQLWGATLPCPAWRLCLLGVIGCCPIGKDIANRTPFAFRRA